MSKPTPDTDEQIIRTINKLTDQLIIAIDKQKKAMNQALQNIDAFTATMAQLKAEQPKTTPDKPGKEQQ